MVFLLQVQEAMQQLVQNPVLLSNPECLGRLLESLVTKSAERLSGPDRLALLDGAALGLEPSATQRPSEGGPGSGADERGPEAAEEDKKKEAYKQYWSKFKRTTHPSTLTISSSSTQLYEAEPALNPKDPANLPDNQLGDPTLYTPSVAPTDRAQSSASLDPAEETQVAPSSLPAVFTESLIPVSVKPDAAVDEASKRLDEVFELPDSVLQGRLQAAKEHPLLQEFVETECATNAEEAKAMMAQFGNIEAVAAEELWAFEEWLLKRNVPTPVEPPMPVEPAAPAAVETAAPSAEELGPVATVLTAPPVRYVEGELPTMHELAGGVVPTPHTMFFPQAEPPVAATAAAEDFAQMVEKALDEPAPVRPTPEDVAAALMRKTTVDLITATSSTPVIPPPDPNSGTAELSVVAPPAPSPSPSTSVVMNLGGVMQDVIVPLTPEAAIAAGLTLSAGVLPPPPLAPQPESKGQPGSNGPAPQEPPPASGQAGEPADGEKGGNACRNAYMRMYRSIMSPSTCICVCASNI